MVGFAHLWIQTLYQLDHLVQYFIMRGLLGLSPDSFRIPEDQRVDPLVTVPALVSRLRQQFPLTTARHLLF